jgi:hypothetical protein
MIGNEILRDRHGEKIHGWAAMTPLLKPSQCSFPAWEGIRLTASRRPLLFVQAARHDRSAVSVQLHKLKCGRPINPDPSGEVTETIASQVVMRACDVEPFGLSEPLDQGFLRQSPDLGM